MKARRLPPLAISIGDPAGIGPDVLLSAWARKQSGLESLPDFYVLGDVDVLNARAKLLGLNITASAHMQAKTSEIPVKALSLQLAGQPAVPAPQDASAIIESITNGCEDIFNGHASGLVTLPINKKNLYDAGFEFPGHTEYLGEMAKQLFGHDAHPVMMLAGPDLKAVPITIHIPLKDVMNSLSTELIEQTARIVHNDMKLRFGIAEPRLAFSGLNPHAGEEGALGDEEIRTIQPALECLRSEGLNCIGPLPADTMFHGRARQAYDVALCMYHDQALIPAKALAFDESVNVTLGLPFIRTSPDHGTAYDIAGTGVADPSSFIAALNMAAEMAEQES